MPDPYGYPIPGGVGSAILKGDKGDRGPAGAGGNPLPGLGTITYDSNGNVLTDSDGVAYTWDADEDVDTITFDGVTITAVYDGDKNLIGWS